MTLKAPFPWFGGKSRVADVVWRAFGDTPNYVEPFAGSLAVLLGRPTPAKIETVNDADCFLSNFWRAVQADPSAVAAACDWPVNEADLHARHRWLVGNVPFREAMKTDPEFYDAKVAGWWVWGLSQWIGGGWCAGPKELERNSGKRPSISGTHAGKGVHRKGPGEQIPWLSGKTSGVQQAKSGFVPEQSSAAWGVVQTASRLPSLGNARGVHGADKPPCEEWFRALQERLRRVRVVCGNWTRVLGNSVLGTTTSRNSGMNPCAVFLDPPYDDETRDPDLYAHDDGKLSGAVATWAREHGDDPDLRIALCGYEGEHAMPSTWTCHAWKGLRGYAASENENASRERIWFSPHCLPLVDRQGSLFA